MEIQTTNEERNLSTTNSDVNAKDSKGNTPLLRKVIRAVARIVRKLFVGRTDVDTEGMKIATPATTNPASDFEYTKSAGKVTITGLKDSEMKGEVVIPSTIDGLPVTNIGEWTFYKSIGLTSLTLPEGVTSIGEDAFVGCGNLTIQTPKGSAAEKYAKEENIPLYERGNFSHSGICTGGGDDVGQIHE